MNNKQHKYFKRIANELIFLKARKRFPKLARKNILKLSKIIQDDFLKTYLIPIKEVSDEFHSFFNDVELDFNAGEKRMNTIISETLEKPLQTMMEIIKARQVVSESKDYHLAGFTPKISSMFEYGTNCFGHTAILGSFLRKKGMKIFLAITADHPIIVGEHEGHICEFDIMSKEYGIYKLNGEILDYGYYKVYKPCDTETDDDIYRMYLLFDFDEALVYEIFENFKAYASSFENYEHALLPETVDFITANFAKYRKIIRKIDWDGLQKQLFPEIYRAFSDQKNEWIEEWQRVRSHRYNQDARKELKKILNESIEKSGYENDDEFKKDLDSIVIDDPAKISSFIYLVNGNQLHFPCSTPKRVVDLLESILSRVNSRKSHVREIFNQYIDYFNHEYRTKQLS